MVCRALCPIRSAPRTAEEGKQLQEKPCPILGFNLAKVSGLLLSTSAVKGTPGSWWTDEVYGMRGVLVTLVVALLCDSVGRGTCLAGEWGEG